MSRQRGSVLILVLWTLSVFAVFAMSLGASARTRATLLSRVEALKELEAAALAGVEAGRAVVAADPTMDLDTLRDDWAAADKIFSGLTVGNASVEVGYGADPGLQDEESKVNLNKAEAAVIARLLEKALELDRDEAEQVAYRIVDWRDQDSNYGHPQYGAEDDEYESLPLPYAAKDAPLETLEELLLIQGVNRTIFDKMKPHVTVHGSGVVNLNTATRETLIAIGLEERSAEKILSYRAGPDGIPASADDFVFPQPQAIIQMLDQAEPPLDGTERAALSNLILAEKIGTLSTAFSVRSTATSRSGASLVVDAVLDRKGKILRLKASDVQWPSRS